MKILEPEWAIPLPEKALDGCIDDENMFILAKVKISYLRFSKNFETLLLIKILTFELGEKSVFVYDKKSRSRCATHGVQFGSGATLGILKVSEKFFITRRCGTIGIFDENFSKKQEIRLSNDPGFCRPIVNTHRCGSGKHIVAALCDSASG